MARKKLGEVLYESGAIDADQLQSALGWQRQWGGRLGRVLVQMRFVSDDQVADVLASQLDLPSVRLQDREIDEEILGAIPQAICERELLLPYEIVRSDRGQETIRVAMSDPTNLAIVDDLAFRTGRRIEVAVAPDSDVEKAIRRHFYGERPDDRGPISLDEARLPGHEVEFAAPVVASQPVVELTEAEMIPDGIVNPQVDSQAWMAAQSAWLAQMQAAWAAQAQTAAQPLPSNLTMRERLLLDSLEALVREDGEPTQPRELFAALLRLLIRKGIVTEDEFAAELARK